MSISLFTPIVHNSNPKENLAVLRFTTGFFNFGQTCYRVTSVSVNKSFLERVDHQKPSWLGIALRIVAILTIITPLFMLLGAMVYRAANKFEVQQLPKNDLFAQLSDEVVNIICGQALFEMKALNLVNKKLNTLFKTPAFNRNLFVSLALEESLRIAGLLQGDEKTISTFVKFLFENGFHKQAMELSTKKMNSALYAENWAEYFKVMALYDIEEALKMPHSSSEFKEYLLSVIAVSLVPKNLKKAYEIYDSIVNNLNKSVFLRTVAIETAKFDLDAALEIVETIEEEQNKILACIGICKNLETQSQKAKELYETLPFDILRRYNLVLHMIPHYVKNLNMDPNQIGEIFVDQIHCYGFIAEEYVKVDPKGALQWVKTLSSNVQFYPMRAIMEGIKDIKSFENAKELIEEMLTLKVYGEYDEKIACAGLMAELDLPRAEEIANGFRSDDVRAYALIGIIEKIIHRDLPEALRLAVIVLTKVMKQENRQYFSLDGSQRFELYFKLAKALKQS